MPSQLTIERSTDSSSVVLALKGELDIASAPELEEALRTVEAGKPGRVTLDLSGLQFMDSTGLRTLVLAQRRAQTEGHELTLRRAPHQVQRLFELTGSVESFTFED